MFLSESEYCQPRVGTSSGTFLFSPTSSPALLFVLEETYSSVLNVFSVTPFAVKVADVLSLCWNKSTPIPNFQRCWKSAPPLRKCVGCFHDNWGGDRVARTQSCTFSLNCPPSLCYQTTEPLEHRQHLFDRIPPARETEACFPCHCEGLPDNSFLSSYFFPRIWPLSREMLVKLAFLTFARE